MRPGDRGIRTDLPFAKFERLTAGLNAHILLCGKHLAGHGSLGEAGIPREKYEEA